MKKTTILLVDDHDILMEGIAALLEGYDSLEVIGKASSPTEAQALVQQVQPSVVITDISMGGQSGIDFAQWVRQHYPALPVIILSMHNDYQHIAAALEAGANGYLLKNIKGDELLHCIQQVLAGEAYLQRSLEPLYLQAKRQQEEALTKSPLTPREMEIIRLIAQGFTTSEISKQLFISEHTVETHRKNISRKTGTKTAIALVNFAREQNLL